MAAKSLKNRVLDAGANLLIGPNPADAPAGESGVAQAAEKPSLPAVAPPPATAPAKKDLFSNVGGPSQAQPRTFAVNGPGQTKPFFSETTPAPPPAAPGQAPDLPTAAPVVVGTAGPAGTIPELAAAKNATAGKPGRPSIPAPAAEPASPGDRYNAKADSSMLMAGEAPLLTNRQGANQIIAGSEPWSPDRGKLPETQDDRMMPGSRGYFDQTGISPKGGGGFTRGGADVAPGDMPEFVRGGGGGAATIQGWNPQRGAMGGQRQNIFANLIPQAVNGAAESFAAAAAPTSMTGPAGESARTRRMGEEDAAMGGGNRNSFDRFDGLRGPNGLISKSMVRLREQGMQNRATMRGQDIGANTAQINERGEMTRASITDATARRGQDMAQETARYGRDTDLAREGVQQDTSFGVANRQLAGQVYSADQNTARAAATSIAKTAGIDDSTVNKMMEMSVDPNTGIFSPEIFKGNYEAILKQMGGNVGPGAPGAGEGQTGRDRNGNRVVKRNGKWVPLNK